MPWQGASNEYPQHMFSSRNEKNIDSFWLEKAPYQELWIQSDLCLWSCVFVEVDLHLRNCAFVLADLSP